MARRSKNSARASRRKGDSAVKLLGMGAVLTILPFFLGAKTPFGTVLTAARPLGLIMLAAGALLMWIANKGARESTASTTTGLTPSDVGAGPDQQQSASPKRFSRRAELSGTKAVPIAASPQAAATRTETATVVRTRPAAWNKGVFDVIEWRRFEAVVERLFQQAGFETKSQSHGADGGVDVWLYSRNQPGAPVSLVQCKHWQGKRVGVDKVRELRGVMAANNVKRGQFATTSTFTLDAVEFAHANGVNLLDVDGLLALIAKRTPDDQDKLLDVALEGDYWRPTCVNCGFKMVERKPGKGGLPFWGCADFPKCKTKMPMRQAA